MVPLNIPSDVSRTELSIIICPGAYTPMTQMLTTPGAGMAVALMVAPPVAVRVDSEVPVAKQSPEVTAFTTACCSAEVFSPGGLACLPCC